MQKVKLLVVIPQAFHTNVGNAGCRTVNFYVNSFLNDGRFDVALAYTGNDDQDYRHMRAEYPSVKMFVAFGKKSPVQKAIDYTRFNYLYPQLKKVSPKHYVTDYFTTTRIRKALREVKSSNFQPDVVIVEFPRLIFQVEAIKSFFSKGRFVASCHDVNFLSVQRYMQQRSFNRQYSKLYYNQFKKLEIKKLLQFDDVVLLNDKDKALLQHANDSLKKIAYSIAPYYDFYPVQESQLKNSVVFFGSMSRQENVDAVEWFLENVWKKVYAYFDGKVWFNIVGGGLKEGTKLRFKTYNNVVLSGFVTDPTEIFSQSFCFVVPLRMGAGIKIKVLDAMNSGIPVVTNDIGIEGIPATHNIDYLHAADAETMYENIVRLQEDKQLQATIAGHAKRTVKKYFDYRQSYKGYSNRIFDLVKSKI